MKRGIWIVTAIILLLIVVCMLSWRYNSLKNDRLEVMCKSSVTAALEHFEEYEADKKESDYIAGVAEFRTYMTAYLCLQDEAGDTDYIWCNILYGAMVLNSEKVKAHTPDLVDALKYLAEDYDHPNGFNLINVLNNKLKTA